MRIALVGAELEENLAVRYLAGALEREGHEVLLPVFDEVDQTEFVAHEIVAAAPEIVGFSLVFTSRASEFVGLAERCRALGLSRAFFVAGGHFAAFNAERLLADVSAFDAVGVGEGESLLCDLATALQRHQTTPEQLDAVGGLVWRRRALPGDAADEIVCNPPGEKPSALDDLAWPKRTPPFDSFLGLQIANVLSSRGCSHACAFCSIAAWHQLCGGERFRQRVPEQVAAELATLYRQGVRIFNFHDDNFLLRSREESLERIDALRRALSAEGVGQPIAFAIKARPDAVDPQVFAGLVELGLFRVFLGIEAGTAEALRQLGRGQRLDDNRRALAVVDDLGVHACYNLLLFNPDSTLEDVAENVAFLRRHDKNPINFCRTEVYAGTPLERRLRAAGRLRGDYWGYDYAIADPRAQRAFEVTRVTFMQRNSGLRALHHLVMQVDYEHQLAAHFFGRDHRLRGRVKRFVRTVNANSAGHLERVVELAARRAGRGRIARLGDAVQADNRRLTRAADELLTEIRLLARERAAGADRRASGRSWRQTAAAAGLAASLLLPACGSCGGRSQPTEMAPVPTSRPKPKSTPQPTTKPATSRPATSKPATSKPATSKPAPAQKADQKRPKNKRVKKRRPKKRRRKRPTPHHTEMLLFK